MNKYIKILYNQPRPFRFLISRILWRSGMLEIFFIKFQLNGYFLRLSPTSLSISLWLKRELREIDSDILGILLRPGDNYIDVGANIGHLAIKARLLVGDLGCVTAIEAHPRTATFLRDNFKLNNLDDVRLANIALGETPSWIQFSDIRQDDQNSVLNSGGINVPCLPLDALETGNERIFLKIDVEGYEKFVLQGAKKTLENVDFIYFEAWDEHFKKYNYSFEEVFNYLHKNGFEIGIPSIKKIEVIDHTFKCSDCINLLAFKSREVLLERSGWKLGSKGPL